MNDLEKIFREHQGNLIHKWDHYFEIYDRHFRRFRNEPLVLLEIGVSKGGSLEMWRKYFGGQCTIIGIDINPACKQFEDEKTKIFIGSQDDRNFLRSLKQSVPRPQILIDDGGHMMHHLRITFEELYDWVDDDGVYLAEDLHTCYWPVYEGGYKRKNSFMEYCKGLTDQLNAWHSQQPGLTVNEFTRSTHSIHFYDSIVAIEKRKMKAPGHSFSGKKDAADVVHEDPRIPGRWRRWKNEIYKRTGIQL
ncbi:MAG TPA: class I SAM-dependent methyltransferase [Chitinophagaceae bacterium]|nr:class I SAM-dependent methyltransferase [Chitinophagaceae bacterium]